MARQWGRRAAVAVAWCGTSLSAHAGLTLDQALERHRQRLDQAAGTGTGFDPQLELKDGFTAGAGGPPDDVPYLMTPTLRGRGGVRWVGTVAGQDAGPRLRLGVAYERHGRPQASLEGSSGSVPVGTGELYASVETRHWGPGWSGSLILDAGAPAIPAVGWRKTDPKPFETPLLAWLGPWNADVFIGRLSGHLQPARPQLVGMQVRLRPFEHLEIGFARTIQWGGHGRSESVRTFFNALAGRDNTNGPDEPGNQLGGFSLRWSVPLARGEWAAYVEGVGEDEAGLLPSQWSGLLGTELGGRSGGASWRVFTEYASTRAGDVAGRARPGSTYRHHIFAQGYTQRGLPLGYPVGGDARLASAGGMVQLGDWALMSAVHAGRATAIAQRYAPGSALRGAEVSASIAAGTRSRVGLGAWHWRAGPDRSSALQAWVQTSWR